MQTAKQMKNSEIFIFLRTGREFCWIKLQTHKSSFCLQSWQSDTSRKSTSYHPAIFWMVPLNREVPHSKLQGLYSQKAISCKCYWKSSKLVTINTVTWKVICIVSRSMFFYLSTVNVIEWSWILCCGRRVKIWIIFLCLCPTSHSHLFSYTTGTQMLLLQIYYHFLPFSNSARFSFFSFETARTYEVAEMWRR